ncbi:MAG: hypothetical protein LIO91_06435 [Bacteroidales bacterium]|nr:hypothetical protein [Bacteroidales bacterium]
MNLKRLRNLLILSILTLALSPCGASAGTVYFDNTDANWTTVYAHFWGGRHRLQLDRRQERRSLFRHRPWRRNDPNGQFQPLESGY